MALGRTTSRPVSSLGMGRFGTQTAGVALLLAYAVALLAIPSNVGLQIGTFVLSPARIVLGLLIVVVLWDGHLIGAVRDAPRAVLLGWALFLITAATTTVLYHSSQAISRFGSLVIEGGALYVAAWYFARRDRSSGALQVAVIATTTIVAGTTLLLAVFGVQYGDLFRSVAGIATNHSADMRFGISRQEGSFSAPLFFATWLVGASLLVLPWLTAERRGRKLLAWSVWCVLLAATIATASRGGIVFLFAGAGLYFTVLRRPKTAAAMWALALVSTLIVVGVSFPSLSSPASVPHGGSGGGPTPIATRVPASQVALERSTSLRIEGVKATVTVVREKPLFGWGLLSAPTVLSAATGKANYVDDTYVQILVEQGLLGFLAFGLLVLATFWVALRRPRSPVQLSRILAVLGVLGMCVLASFLSVTQGYAAFCLLLVLATVPSPAPLAEGHSFGGGPSQVPIS